MQITVPWRRPVKSAGLVWRDAADGGALSGLCAGRKSARMWGEASI
jgi:hypothetical protein